MSNVLDFARGPSTIRIESQSPNLTTRELEACEMARAIRADFTDAEVAAIAAELEEVGDDL